MPSTPASNPLLLTSDDGGAALERVRLELRAAPSELGPLVQHAAKAAGAGVATLLAPVERRDLRGAAYTMVLRKPR